MLKPPVSDAQNEWGTLSAAIRVVPALGVASLALILFGIKLLIIGTYGNATPYWDQWGFEAKWLYAPFLEGRLAWIDTLAPHNEHRMLASRLLALGLLSANGVWNPLLQMVVNAGLHVGLVSMLVSMLTMVVGRQHVLAILAFCLVLFGCPYGSENTLWGNQSCIYFLFLFSVGSIWLVIGAAPFSAWWWAGAGLSVCAFFSFAAGLFAPAALAGVGVLQYLTGTRTSRAHVASVLALGCLLAIGVACTPRVLSHAPMRATTLTQLVHAWNGFMGWPIRITLLGPLLRNAPAVLFAVMMLRTRPPAEDRRWFLFALILWMFGQSLALAYGRASGSLPSRYQDHFAIDVLTNFACLLSIVQNGAAGSRWMVAAAVAWTFVVLTFLGYDVHMHSRRVMNRRLEKARAQELNTRNYVRTGNMHHLTDKPDLHIPYPKPSRLATFLDTPSIRAILPKNIGVPLKGELTANMPSGGCVADGYGPGVPVPMTDTWGTYGSAGPATTGAAAITFSAAHRGYRVEIPVAGQSRAEGITLEIEQDGKRWPLHVVGDRDDAWGSVTAEVRGRPFTLHITDTSPDAWLAVGSPVAEGRWDGVVEKLLARWDVFVIMGSVMAVALLTFVSLARPS
jgi:hypothetical protein